jgi:hypothetical protein
MNISVRTSLAARVPPGTGIVSIRTVANGLHPAFPITFRDIVGLLEPIKLTFQLNAGTCSGWCEITMSSDGLIHYTGKVHDSGALAASYVAITSFPTLIELTTFPAAVAALVAALGPVVISHKGHVGGTFSFDSRDSSWDETATDARIADNWVAVREAAMSARTDFGTNTGALELIDGFVSGATGIFIFGL